MLSTITKVSGEKENFDSKKLFRSLEKAGIEPKVIQRLIEQIEKNDQLKTTQQIYQYALKKLSQTNPVSAARYNIKNALLQLGPAGFPFEQFIMHILQAEGYKTKTNQIIHGKCITHEIDIIIQKEQRMSIVECKYHNRQYLKSDVKVPLYVQGRLADITQKRENHDIINAWIVTNTKFTSQAIKFGHCANITLLSWDYPEIAPLPSLIQKYNLFPITALVSLSNKEKEMFIKNGFVLCKDVQKHLNMLKKFGLTTEKINRIIQETAALCNLA